MINRYELVNRHNPVLTDVQIKSPLSVGNGEFAFTADITGLQSFPEDYQSEIPICTMAQWGWHSFGCEDKGFNRDNLEHEFYKNREREIPYASSDKGQKELFDYLRQNPHKFHLGQIGLNMIHSSGDRVGINDIKNINQKLDIWQGIIISKFTVEGVKVKVKTICHPDRDLLAFSIKSELIVEKRLHIDIKFPYAAVDKTSADWNSADKHKTILKQSKDGYNDFLRIMDKEK
ncbi:MAG: hypothetical protein ACOCRU_01240 [bacterium]